MTAPRIGIALGGGGARGMAHVPVLEALDDLGVRPAAMSGTSIGAIFAAGYAGGLSGEALREIATTTFRDRNAVLARLWKLRPRRFGDFFGSPGLMQFDALRVLETFVGESIPDSFEELEIPLSVIATDFYACCAVTLAQGSLPSAVAASMAIPALFKPVNYEDRVLVDGGIVNPLPFDALPPDLDIVVASDVVGSPMPRKGRRIPRAGDALFGSIQVLMQSITVEKLKNRAPDILVKPDIPGYRVLDFLKTEEILARAEPMREQVKRELAAMIERFEKDGTTA
jgi:NTE family protein